MKVAKLLESNNPHIVDNFQYSNELSCCQVLNRLFYL